MSALYRKPLKRQDDALRIIRDNGLTFVLVAFSIVTIGGMLLTGWGVYNEELVEHGGRQLGLLAYASSGHFLSAIFENWESEFPADVSIRHADRIPLPARLGGIQES